MLVYIHISMYVCMSVCMYVCMSGQICVHTSHWSGGRGGTRDLGHITTSRSILQPEGLFHNQERDLFYNWETGWFFNGFSMVFLVFVWFVNGFSRVFLVFKYIHIYIYI